MATIKWKQYKERLAENRRAAEKKYRDTAAKKQAKQKVVAPTELRRILTAIYTEFKLLHDCRQMPTEYNMERIFISCEKSGLVFPEYPSRYDIIKDMCTFFIVNDTPLDKLKAMADGTEKVTPFNVWEADEME